MIKGPLKKLKWSDWKLAVCRTHPRGYTKTEFKPSRSIENACLRQRIFGNNKKTACIYEIGVRFPETNRPKMFILTLRTIMVTPNVTIVTLR